MALPGKYTRKLLSNKQKKEHLYEAICPVRRNTGKTQKIGLTIFQKILYLLPD